MILLRPDCLVFETADGDHIPCSAQEMTIELIGEAVSLLDEETVRHAAAAVLHYFRVELDRLSVSVAEFSAALEQVLRKLGLKVAAPDSAETAAPPVRESDLRPLAHETAGAGELFFFPRLRDELRRHLRASPRLLRFRGLRGCVKQLTGAKRWSPPCQRLNDHIVEFLRTCLHSEENGAGCALVVS